MEVGNRFVSNAQVETRFQTSGLRRSIINLIENGTFDDASVWTLQSAWSISGGVASCDGTQSTQEFIWQPGNWSVGDVLQVSYDVTRTAGSVRSRAGNGDGASDWHSASGSYVDLIVADDTSNFYIQGNAAFVGTVDNVVVRSLPAQAPAITAAGSLDVETFFVGTTQTITPGMVTANYGGTITYETRHVSDGETKSTSAAYAHVSGDIGETATAEWRGVETVGDHSFYTDWQTVGSGTISASVDQAWVITGHSRTDDWTIKAGSGNNGTEDLAAADGITYTEYLASGPYSAAEGRYNTSSTIAANTGQPDLVNVLNTVSGLTYLVGIEAMNDLTGLESYVDDYGNPPATAFAGALLWHEAAENAGCANHFYVRWPGANSAYGGFNQSWRDAITDEEWPRWDSIKTYVDANKSGSLPFTFVYVDAMYAVLFDRIQAGTYTEFAIGDFFSDNVHASDLGKYAELKMVWCTIRGTLPTAYTALTYGGMSSSITSAQRDEIDDLIADVIADPTIALTSGASEPDAFGASDWSVADADVGGTATVTISSLPANNGASITRIDYRINGGSWVDSGVTSATTFNILGLTDGVQVTVELRAANSIGNGTDSDDKTVTPTAGVPDAFESGDWSIANAASGGTATVTISSLPATNGAPISRIDYRVDGGSWVDSGVTTATTFDITGLTNDVQVSVDLRAANSAGNGTDSDDKTVTPTSGASAPDAFVIGDWSVADATTGGTVTVTISSLPANNGASITQIDYRVDAGSWADSGVTTATTFNIGSLTDDTEYTIELRATNSAGSSGDSDDKTVTPTTAASSPATYGGISEVAATRTGNSLPVSLTGITSTSSDIIIAIMPTDANNGATDDPASASAGWTSIGSVYDSGFSNIGLQAWWARGDVSSLTLTLNASGTTTRPIILVEVQNADTTTPIAASSFDVWGDTVGAGQWGDNDIVTADVTAPAGGFVIAGYMNQSNDRAPGAAATGYTNRLDMRQGDYTNVAGLALQTQGDMTAGATGNVSHNFSTGAWDNRITFIIAVNPA